MQPIKQKKKKSKMSTTDFNLENLNSKKENSNITKPENSNKNIIPEKSFLSLFYKDLNEINSKIKMVGLQYIIQ